MGLLRNLDFEVFLGDVVGSRVFSSGRWVWVGFGSGGCRASCRGVRFVAMAVLG